MLNQNRMFIYRYYIYIIGLLLSFYFHCMEKKLLKFQLEIWKQKEKYLFVLI